MAQLLSLAVSSLEAPGCVSRVAGAIAQSRRTCLGAGVPVQISRVAQQGRAVPQSEFLGRGESSSRLFAAAAAAAAGGACPLRRAHLESATLGLPRAPPGAVVAGLGDFSVATAAAYGVSLFLGGLFAFIRTGSKGSLGGGLTGAALYGTTFYLLQSPSTESLGNALGFGTGLLFSAVFAIRLFATGKPVPAGPLLGISALATAVFASAYFG